MSDILVEKDIVMRPINTIKPYVRNPRKNDKTVDLLCKIIPKVGFNVPLLIDEHGVIIKGHARFTAAIRLGMTELPCIISHADEEAIKADRIADNKISEFSEWIDDELRHELDMIDLDFDLTELGFPAVSFDDIPTMDDFETSIEEDAHEITAEERKRLYEEFLEAQAKENSSEAQIVSQDEIEAAQAMQKKTAQAPPQYYKCVCEKCGHIMFVRADAICDRVEG